MGKVRELLEEVEVCISCKGLAPCRKMPADCHGTQGSNVMVVSQFPDKRSFELDRYWSNPPGEKLRGIFTDIGADPEKTCWITDALKCLPPENRKPSEQELSTCRAYLEREISILAPRYIVPVGDTATRSVFAVFGLEPVTILKLHNENGVKEVAAGAQTIVPVQHPSQAPRFMDFVLYRYHLKDLFKRLLKH